MSLLALSGTNSASGGYDIDNSLKLEADNTELIYRTNNSGTNSKTFTVSAWFKRTELGVDQQVWHGGTFGEATRIGILSYLSADDNLWVDVAGGTGNPNTLYRSFSTLKIRDTSAWYHVCVAVDTTQATEANRMKVWLNGVEVTDWAQHQIPAQNFQCALESGNQMAWGGYRPSNVVLFSGYLAECHYLDGVAKVQTDFGEYDEDSGIWKPKKYTGTYGGNGCYLDFESSGSLGADSSGNSNNFTLNNITSADQATDTPTNNFCTLNPLDNNWANVPIINEGATNHHSDSANFEGSSGTIAVSNGKWYWEIKTTHSGGNVYMLGIGSTEYGEVPGSQSPHDVLNFAGLYLANSATEGGLFVTDSTGGSVYRNAFNPGANHSANDIYGFALDLDSSPQTITFYRNGTNINPSSGAPLDIAGACSILPVTIRLSIFEREAQCNFGGYTEFSISSAASDANGYGTFEYAPPSGYYALCTKNLAEYG